MMHDPIWYVASVFSFVLKIKHFIFPVACCAVSTWRWMCFIMNEYATLNYLPCYNLGLFGFIMLLCSSARLCVFVPERSHRMTLRFFYVCVSSSNYIVWWISHRLISYLSLEVKSNLIFQCKANFILILYCLMFQAAKLQEISQVSEGDLMDWLIFYSISYIFLFFFFFLCYCSINIWVTKTDDYP